MNKKTPKFKNEDEEREFWATHDSTELVDWKKAKKIVLPDLKPSLKTISLRLPETMIEKLKTDGGFALVSENSRKESRKN